jgi:hypothetical protein
MQAWTLFRMRLGKETYTYEYQRFWHGRLLLISLENIRLAERQIRHKIGVSFSRSFRLFRPRIAQMILGAFAKFRKVTVSFVMSLRPHGTIRCSLDECSRN